MSGRRVLEKAVSLFEERFKEPPRVASFAPGRIEVLGNHTDYNEGYVLSAAIDRGTYFLAAPGDGSTCRVVAGDVLEEARFRHDQEKPDPDHSWARYVLGVVAGIAEKRSTGSFPAFNGLFLGDVPLGAGLSSSAALEMSAGLAVSHLAEIDLPILDLARIGQEAEHRYAGVRTGLLDQITSLHGKKDNLVLTDFRHLQVTTTVFGRFCFLVCDTGVRHTLVDSAYNDRRASCERAAVYFAERLDHPVRSLRDVNSQEWESHGGELDETDRLRSAHVIGENERVLAGSRFLHEGRIEEFGSLMFASHESSRVNFENSVEELDLVVSKAEEHPSVLGARLTGGGFGGSVIVLTGMDNAEAVAGHLRQSFAAAFHRSCDILRVQRADGAHLVDPQEREGE